MSLTPEARVEFPKYTKMFYDKGWILGVWNIGNNYKWPHSH